MGDSVQVFTRELRSLPAWLLCEYLVDLGGAVGPDGTITGPGWSAAITQIEDFAIGSLRVGQIRLVWQGDEQAVETVWPQVEQKLQRAGG